MKWDNLYLIKLSADKVINESASTYRKYYTIPKARRFVPAGESSKADSDWTLLGPGSLSSLTFGDKLMIVAHGTPTQAGERTFRVLASDLNEWGLAEVGLITFKCCDIGRGEFLEKFVKYAGAVSRIKIGWVKGYRGAAITQLGGPFKPFEEISNENSRGFKTGQSRYKIVAGLAASNITGSRYLLAGDD